MNRNLVIVGSAVVLHIAGLWALQSGLLRRAVEVVVPAEILSDFITPPAPKADIPQPVAKPPTPQPATPTAHQPQPQPSAAPAPQLLAVADATPSPNAPTGTLAPQPPAPPIAAPVATPAAPAPPAPPAKVELPSSAADYLNNPKPAYPSLSKRLGEQGKVELRVLIGADGTPQKAEIKTSSGFDRLDQAALNTVLKWRYVPGKRGGVAEAMWFTVPINFVLE